MINFVYWYRQFLCFGFGDIIVEKLVIKALKIRFRVAKKSMGTSKALKVCKQERSLAQCDDFTSLSMIILVL